MGLSFPPFCAASVGASVGALVRDGKRDQRNRVWSSEPEMRSSGIVVSVLLYRSRAHCWADRSIEVNHKARWVIGWLTFFVRCRAFWGVIEGSGPQNEIRVQTQSIDPVSVILQDVPRPSLRFIRDTDRR